MSKQFSLQAAVEPVLSRYSKTSLVKRWEEAVSYVETEPIAFWIRESGEIVNIVWLTRYDIRDITLFKETGTSTFNLTLLSAIIGVEVREGDDAARHRGLNVSGDYLVDIHTSFQGAGLIWVASDEKEVAGLRKFVDQVFRLLPKR